MRPQLSHPQRKGAQLKECTSQKIPGGRFTLTCKTWKNQGGTSIRFSGFPAKGLHTNLSIRLHNVMLVRSARQQ